jgi:alpha-1,2-mannosyltransferase
MLGLSMVAFVIVRVFSRHTILGDLGVYRAEGMAIRHGANLYAHLDGAHNLGTYPPFAAVMFVVLTLVPFGVVQVLCLIVNVGLLALVCWLGCQLAGVRGRDALVPVLAFTAIATWSEPIFTTFAYGQINLLLLALVLWDFTLPETSRWRGVGTGIAAGWKVTPGILILYLLLTRRFRAAATAAATFVGTIGLSGLVDWHDTWRYWTHYLFQLSRVGHVENPVNQTIRGVAVRAGHNLHVPPYVVALVGVVLIAGLAIARLAYRRFGDAWGLPAAAVTGLLSSPIAWSHHWVWALPIAIVLWVHARRWLVAVVAVFMTWAVWYVSWITHDWLHLNAAEIAASCFYVLFGLGFLALTGWRSWATPRSGRVLR